MKKNFFPVLISSLLFLLAVSCGNDEDPIIVDLPEIITTLTYTLTPTGGGDQVVMTFKDLDGDGGDEPVVTGGNLSANTTYAGQLALLNESVSPADDIGAEVLEEAVDHQFFFTSTIAQLSIAYTDTDANGKPLGLNSTLTTVDPGDGTITIILRHEPDKSANGVSDGEISNAGGETDIEVSFDVRVE